MDRVPGGFLGLLTDEERAALRSCGRERRFPRGAIIFSEGESADRVVVVLGGRVKVSFFTEDGREVLLAVREPGDLIGELSAIDEEPRSASATTMEPVEALLVPAERFRGFVEEHPRVSLVLLGMLSRRLRDADRKRVEFGTYDTVGRVARRLVEMVERFGEDSEGGVTISLPLTQQELAGWIGSSREAVSKALQTLRERGWVEIRRKGIRVLDLGALRERAT